MESFQVSDRDKKWVRKGDVQSLIGIRVLMMRVNFGFLWQLKSTGMRCTVRFILMKVFEKSFKFRKETIIKQMCNLSAYSRTILGLE